MSVAVKSGRCETILVVEDDKSVRVTCELFLEWLGYRILVAETPTAALKLAAEHPGDLDLLLADVVMPGMDGQELARRIDEMTPAIKVLFMSGCTANAIDRHCVRNEGVHVLSKPFTRTELAHSVREMLDAESHARANDSDKDSALAPSSRVALR